MMTKDKSQNKAAAPDGAASELTQLLAIYSSDGQNIEPDTYWTDDVKYVAYDAREARITLDGDFSKDELRLFLGIMVDS